MIRIARPPHHQLMGVSDVAMPVAARVEDAADAAAATLAEAITIGEAADQLPLIAERISRAGVEPWQG